ncbi:MAG: LUD domain-containing protein [Chloroflexi bacterium]|nr:LUD domain-containing protein [Chloroflexota bacterium]
MNATFRDKIREKIADDSLQAALDANAERRVRARINAMASLPDWRERRHKAHVVRAEVIEHLDEYLAQFIASVRSNGIVVHRAKDSAEAIRIVLAIAEKSNPSGSALLFAKAKSMVTEEIGLNHALEVAGHRVVETDLGEYIVQLRGERPGHIITPAVHLRRHQVGQLFHEKLGIPYTEDIPTLTNTARAILREVFFSANIGISGVNFGVAETGTLTIVSNEGNARMCTSLPPVHIALMGMERLLPASADLSLFLSLLPRSATGQKLSVYTQLIQRPEGGQQKHLVILDNGRSRLRNSPLKESLYCIRCGACLNVCPVFREIGGHAYIGTDGSSAPYPGPIGSVISPGLSGENFLQLAQASSLCGACKDACPVDIDLPKLLLRVRAGQYPHPILDDGSEFVPVPEQPGILKLALSFYCRLAVHPRLFAIAQKLAGWFSNWLPAYIALPDATGWGLSKDMPKPAARPFRERFAASASNYNGTATRFEPEIPISIPAVALAPIRTVPDLSADELAAYFTRELTALGGQVYPIWAGDFPDLLVKFLYDHSLTKIQICDDVCMLTSADLEAQGLTVYSSYTSDVQVGITGAMAGIAETGTLVLRAGDGAPLIASLAPEIHIAVLQISQILQSLDQTFQLPDIVSAPATVLISGPSRTADIEMTLTIGVHGPRELHVFLVDDTVRK